MKNKEFIAGIVYSAALVVKLYDEPTIAKTILTESGFTKSDFKKYSDEYDFNIIKDLL